MERSRRFPPSSVPANAARILLDALCPPGLLSKSEGIYSLPPAAETFLVRGKPTYCADASLTVRRDRDRLEEAVRTGRATLDISGPQAEEMWANPAAPELLAWPHGVETARERWACWAWLLLRREDDSFEATASRLGL